MNFSDLAIKETKELVKRAALVLTLAEGKHPEGAAAALALGREIGEMLTLLSSGVQSHMILSSVMDLLEAQCREMQSTLRIADREIGQAFSWPASNPRVWDDLPLETVVFEDEDEGEDL